MIPAACIVVAVLLILAALEPAAWSFVVSRFKRRARRTYTDMSLWQPEVPEFGRCAEADIEGTWEHPWPADTPTETMAQAYYAGLPLDDQPTEVIEALVMDRLAFYDVVRGEFPTEGLAS